MTGGETRRGRTPTPGGPLDPGLQSERTSLAWVRTALALAANAALVMRAGLSDRLPALTLAGVGLALVSVVVGIVGWRRHDTIVARIVDGRPPVTPATLRLPAVAVVAAAVVVLVAVLR